MKQSFKAMLDIKFITLTITAIVLLCCLLIPVYNYFDIVQGRKAYNKMYRNIFECEVNLLVINEMIKQHKKDGNATLPSLLEIQAHIAKSMYANSETITSLKCPKSSDSSGSYVYLREGLPYDLPDSVILACDSDYYHCTDYYPLGRKGVLFADSRVEFLTKEDFKIAWNKDIEIRKTMKLGKK